MVFNSKPNENSYYCQFLPQLDESRKILVNISIMINGKIFEGLRNILTIGIPLFEAFQCISNKERPNQNNTAYFGITVIQGCCSYLGLFIL